MGFLDKLLGRTKKASDDQPAGSSMGVQEPASTTEEPAPASAPPMPDQPDGSGDEATPA